MRPASLGLAASSVNRTCPAARAPRDRVQPVLEFGDHAEVAAAAAQRPEQVRVLLGAGPQHLTCGSDDPGGQQVVARQPVLRGEPAEPAAQGQPAYAGVADRAAGGGQAMSLGGRVQLRQRCPAADPGGPPTGMDITTR